MKTAIVWRQPFAWQEMASIMEGQTLNVIMYERRSATELSIWSTALQVGLSSVIFLRLRETTGLCHQTSEKECRKCTCWLWRLCCACAYVMLCCAIYSILYLVYFLECSCCIKGQAVFHLSFNLVIILSEVNILAVDTNLILTSAELGRCGVPSCQHL